MAAETVGDKGLGARLMQLRERQSVGLRELSRRAGLSASSLSAVEKGRSSPTLATLQRILQALGTGFGEFFAAPVAPEAEPVFRSGNMAIVRDPHRIYTLLFPRRDDLRFEALHETLMPIESAPEWEIHAFDVGGVLLKGGPVRLEIEGRGAWRVNRGDAFYIKAGEKHRARNEGDGNAVQITVMCPPRY
ncbi:MAG: helix-turn-helix domain-containing protein [Kiritimatiellia bacterium]